MSGLEAKPGAITLGLDDLVDLAWKGRIRVPHFQRDFRWNRQDVIRLFDSILKRYPIGSLLLWRRPAPRQRVVLGAIEVDAPAVDDATWVVDGQQRITSLANVPIEDPQVIPLSVIFDLAKVLTWFAERPEAAEHRSKAFDLAKYLREVKIPHTRFALPTPRTARTRRTGRTRPQRLPSEADLCAGSVAAER